MAPICDVVEVPLGLIAADSDAAYPGPAFMASRSFASRLHVQAQLSSTNIAHPDLAKRAAWQNKSHKCQGATWCASAFVSCR
ncbi:uncharacterized protein PITG_10075 [Phytophthora infestans T30-4]|uniref:Uncharacterized protein n=2 Tax=Phytophthora infestans TaxID=4787 RepID=D0NE87_PHYIT|nr:uncharacterized protein PITG_10075 [Phytophthora infestans T30-4]EEY56532.1 hypothetical protein PITG_10075 [Phytophthora infestans T30-4]KAF4042512.1 hypothetical protein GN244_ATG05221 [Phytophthora infestans]KAF4150602.1 hypothetical protein GN958_ATG00264 [Phytophthora infestans]|eukprot:XP_002902606.1 hypothetical protein PITG_10075 [Phytophthora infestans T30-4]